MKSLLLASLVFASSALPPAPSSGRDEGMWLPAVVRDGATYETLKARGLELEPEQMWNPEGAALTDAMLMVGEPQQDRSQGINGYGSAAFVSGQGLVLTNHHVAFDAIAALSRPGEDLVENGFVAARREDERPCPNMAVQVTTDIVDVTDRVLERTGSLEGLSIRERAEKLQPAFEAIREATLKDGASACVVKALREDTRFFLYRYDSFYDVRLVYAPPRSIGEHGGDIDNWMWPRHTGDFSYLRVYVAPDGSRASFAKENVPYRPKRHLKLTTAGIEEGDFCFILGHPGTTWRYRTSYSIDYRERIQLPQQIRQLEAALANFEERAQESEEVRLQVSSTIKQIQNALKNYRGTVEGLAKLDVVERRRAEEERLQQWIDQDEERKARYGDLMPRFAAVYEKLEGGDQAGFMEEIGQLRVLLREAWASYRKSESYFDANLTLRLTYGDVKGYRPKDGVTYRWATTARGILEKETGEKPFDAPAEQLALIRKGEFGRYADPALGSLPLCFLSDCDITGGNSGSPVMNGKGEMIGIAFDGNWEAITSDYLFEPGLSRTISVDIRYVLWCTEKLARLERLLEEMDIANP